MGEKPQYNHEDLFGSAEQSRVLGRTGIEAVGGRMAIGFNAETDTIAEVLFEGPEQKGDE